MNSMKANPQNFKTLNKLWTKASYLSLDIVLRLFDIVSKVKKITYLN